MRQRGEQARALERWHGAAPSIEEKILRRGPLTLLHAAVDQLRVTAPELHAVMRYELDGVPISRAAAELGIPRGTAYTRARRGRAALRGLLRRWEDEEARRLRDATRRAPR
jgi:DNA-directed RNA polymerase specialized sigma24 family protein